MCQARAVKNTGFVTQGYLGSSALHHGVVCAEVLIFQVCRDLLHFVDLF